MAVQQQQGRKIQQRQAKVVYPALSEYLTKTFKLYEKGYSNLPPRFSAESAIHNAWVPHIPLLFYSNSFSEAGIYVKLRD